MKEDLVEEFDNILKELRKKAIICLGIGFIIGVVVGVTLAGL